MKKFVLTVILIVICAFSFVACDNKEQPPKEPEKTEQNSEITEQNSENTEQNFEITEEGEFEDDFFNETTTFETVTEVTTDETANKTVTKNNLSLYRTFNNILIK